MFFVDAPTVGDWDTSGPVGSAPGKRVGARFEESAARMMNRAGPARRGGSLFFASPKKRDEKKGDPDPRETPWKSGQARRGITRGALPSRRSNKMPLKTLPTPISPARSYGVRTPR